MRRTRAHLSEHHAADSCIKCEESQLLHPCVKSESANAVTHLSHGLAKAKEELEAKVPEVKSKQKQGRQRESRPRKEWREAKQEAANGCAKDEGSQSILHPGVNSTVKPEALKIEASVSDGIVKAEEMVGLSMEVPSMQRQEKKRELGLGKEPRKAKRTSASSKQMAMTGKELAVVAEAVLTVASLQQSGPFPAYPRPLPQECWEVRDRLTELHGSIERSDCVATGPALQEAAPCVGEPVLALEWNQEGASLALIDGGDRGQVALDDVGIHQKPRKRGRRTSRKKEPENDEPGPLAQAGVITGHQVAAETQPEWLVERRCVLDALVSTMLSQNTTDITANRAFAELKRQFPTWDEVLAADVRAVEASVKCAGLAEMKVARMRHILQTLLEERGEVSLEYLWDLPTEDIKKELTRFKGVGPKTVACVLMFHLNREEFPVDTHVWHIAKMIGWVPANADREKTYLHLNARVPEEIKFSLHCLLVEHGKTCSRCSRRTAASKTDAVPCPLLNWNKKLKMLEP